jgi:hypothetical protein
LYHIFSQNELATLGQGAWFGQVNQFYVDNTGKKTMAEKEWRNIVSIFHKSIFIE